MKIALISTLDIISWGGSEALWSQTAKLALKKNHQVFTSTYYWRKKPHVITELSDLGAQTFFRRRYQPAVTVRLYNRIKNVLGIESPELRALRKFNPDVLLLSQAGSYDILNNPHLVEFALTTKKPFFIVCHSYEEALVLPENKRNTIPQLFAKAEKVFMISKIQESIISKQLAHKLINSQIVANPVSLKVAAPISFPDLNEIQFASVASLHVPIKGQDIILEVLSQDKWKQRKWRLNIYGDGPDKKYLEELIDFFGLQGRVMLKGHVHDISSVWKQNHLFLLSSRKESGPMALTEAMLCGRPCVSTLVGKVYEIVEDGYNGFVADAPTVMLFDVALERAWQNKEQWATMGERAYHTALAAVDFHAAETFLNILLSERLEESIQ